MGCGSSVSKPCSPEEMAELCQIGCKEMEIVCVREAMAKKDQVKIKAPDCISKFRNNAKKLREAAAIAVKEIDELCGSDKAQAMVGEKKEGFLGQALSMAAQVADSAAAMVGGTAGAIVEKTLTGLAAGVDGAVDSIEDPFTKVGKDILEAKQEDLLTVLADYINTYTFDNPVKLVRGEPPHGEEQYKNCPGDSISRALIGASAEDLANKLLPVVQEEINKHAVTKAWDVLIEKTNSAYDKISEYKKLENFGIEKTDLDINIYIVAQTVLMLGELMGKEETEIRKSPAGKSRLPATFEVVFSGQQLHKGHYKNKDK